MLRRGLRLVETGETAIVTLVEAPVLGHRQPQPPHRFEREVQCLDRPRLDRGEAGVGRDTLCLHQLARRPGLRSEEHTSELQSLMRISYAVFAFEKKRLSS